MATVKNITRPAMMEVLKDSTRCITQMNKKQMLKIIEEKRIVRTSKKSKQRKKAEERKRGQTC